MAGTARRARRVCIHEVIIRTMPAHDTREPPSQSPAGRAPAWVIGLVGGLAHSALMTLAFDPVGVWPAALLSLVPLVWAGLRAARAPAQTSARARRRDSAKLGLAVWAGAMPFFLWVQAWVIDVSAAGYPFMCAYLAVFPALFVLALARSIGRFDRVPAAVLAAALWTGIEVFRGEVAFKGYAWFIAAHPLVEWAPLASPAAIVGTYGVSLLLALVSAAVAAILAGSRGRAHGAVLGGAVVVWAGLAVWGGVYALPTGDRRIHVGVVQTNLPQSNKIAPTYASTMGLWNELLKLTLELSGGATRPDIIVWPETMKPGMSLDAESLRAERDAKIAIFPEDHALQPMLTASFADATMTLSRNTRIPLLVGEESFEGLRFGEHPEGGLRIEYKRRFNSAFMVRDGVVEAERYDKLRLTPFGEEMPYISAWPWLEGKLLDFAARGMKLDLSAGHGLTVFHAASRNGGDVGIVTPICFEATESGLCRSLVVQGGARRADLLVNMTNDGWFGRWGAGRMHHMQIARWRCVELATPMVRAANTGISCAIDARGGVVRLPLPGGRVWGEAGCRVFQVELGAPVTPYARGGWLCGWVCLALAAVLALRSFIPGRTPGRTTGTRSA